MPIEKIAQPQSQGRLFEERLSIKLNPQNKLYKLRPLVNWPELEAKAMSHVQVKRRGRKRKDHRVMLALLMLQAMYNLSDSGAESQFVENVYWQYFCGYEYITADTKVSEASIRRFRNLIGEDGYDEITKELLRIGIALGVVKEESLDKLIVDTTVQIKNIKHPHDAQLMEKARSKVAGLCKSLGIKLNETYAKAFKSNTIKLWKYSKTSKVKKRWKTLKKLKTLLGRLIRVCERGIERGAISREISYADQEILSKAKRIYAQSALTKVEKILYKKEEKILYSFHADEVECIGKGKLNKPYEFGNKVSVVVSGRDNFVLSVKSFHDNPYDGHTLKQATESAEKITGRVPEKLFVDLGYRGNNLREKSKVYMPYTKKEFSKDDKKMMKRRSAIEPIIGHLKNFGRMGCNYLRGKAGDIINPILSAIGFNMRRIAHYLTSPPNLQTL